MTEDLPNPALLPAGFADLLPPDAAREAALVEAMMAAFAQHGYERVKPPLLEFEDSLLTGSGAAVADQTFRLMDPVSQRMMGLRADTTPQVARIAATRLAAEPRPLRLCYAGQVLRVRGTQLAPERQLPQAGIEVIGSDAIEADAEVAIVAVEALAAIGVAPVSLDVTLPSLTPALLDAAGLAALAPAPLLVSPPAQSDVLAIAPQAIGAALRPVEIAAPAPLFSPVPEGASETLMEPSFPAQILRATLFAARAHAGQVRKGAAAEPYVNHVIEVAAILAEHGAPDEAILAGLLHDTVEDTETTDADLVAVFGPLIAGLVAEATDDKDKPKEIRKALQISQASKHSEAAKQLKLADKIANLRSIADSPPANWNHARRIEYVGWAGRVAAGLKGVNPDLDTLFDTTYRAALARLASEMP